MLRIQRHGCTATFLAAPGEELGSPKPLHAMPATARNAGSGLLALAAIQELLLAVCQGLQCVLSAARLREISQTTVFVWVSSLTT